MKNYWTSIKTINGLRHFVLVNESKERGNIIFLMVSLDLGSRGHPKTDKDMMKNTIFPMLLLDLGAHGYEQVLPNGTQNIIFLLFLWDLGAHGL